MKKITFLVTVLFLFGKSVQAQVRSLTTTLNNGNQWEQPIAFTERGIDFFVFPNGEFDFNTVPSANEDIIYRRGHRNWNNDKGILIEQDHLGRIRRIGNVFLNYDFQNRIKRIGSVHMKYNRFALSQIGGMRLIYNHRGHLINTIGFVQENNIRYSYCYSNTNEEVGYPSYYFRRKN